MGDVDTTEIIMADPLDTVMLSDAPTTMSPILSRVVLDDSKAEKALRLLKAGNRRFATGQALPVRTKMQALYRQGLAENEHGPIAVIGCADSRCPVEILFDANPGDLFVLRNAGNTCIQSEGSIVASVEYCVSHLETNLILVLGHTNCGALAGACKTMLANKDQDVCQPCSSVVDHLISELVPMAARAAEELPEDSPFDALLKHAVKVNTFHTVERLVEFSSIVRSSLRDGSLKVEGAIHDMATGAVEFIGPSPRQAEIVGSIPQLQLPRVPSDVGSEGTSRSTASGGASASEVNSALYI